MPFATTINNPVRWFKMLKTIDFKDAATNLENLLKEVKQGTNQYIVKDNGNEMAVLLSYNDFQNLTESKELTRKRFFEMIERLYQRTKDVPLEKIEDAINEAVKVARKNETGESQAGVQISEAKDSEKIAKKLNALEAASGTLNDLTSQEMATFETAIKRRPLFK
jgi:prevent-host-death family protein